MICFVLTGIPWVHILFFKKKYKHVWYNKVLQTSRNWWFIINKPHRSITPNGWMAFWLTILIQQPASQYIFIIFSSAWLYQQSSWNLNLSVVCRTSVRPLSVRPCRNYLWTSFGAFVIFRNLGLMIRDRRIHFEWLLELIVSMAVLETLPRSTCIHFCLFFEWLGYVLSKDNVM